MKLLAVHMLSKSCVLWHISMQRNSAVFQLQYVRDTMPVPHAFVPARKHY